jgi:hypothetical protein
MGRTCKTREKIRIVCEIVIEKPERDKSHRIPRCGWEDNIKMGFN